MVVVATAAPTRLRAVVATTPTAKAPVGQGQEQQGQQGEDGEEEDVAVVAESAYAVRTMHARHT